MGLLQERLAKYDPPQQIKAKGIYPYFRCVESEQNTEVIMSGREVLMLGSNSYLGLTNHLEVIEATVKVTRRYNTGCTGSRFLSDTPDPHLQLKKELAEFVGKENATVYSTGFQVDLGIVSCVTGREDYVIYDELDHASIVEGRHLSFSAILKFKHNNVESLEKKLQRCRPSAVKPIVVDGVFSIESDIASLPEITRLSKKYDANITIDEAHGLGVLGSDGRGTCDHFGLTKEADLIMGTFSKSLTAIDGFITANESIINYLRHNSRSYIFSANNTPTVTAAVCTALQIMKNEPERIEHLWDITNYSLKCSRELGFEIGHTSTLTIPLYVRDTERIFMVTKVLFDGDVFVDPVVPPVRSSNDTLIHFSLVATHSKEQIDSVIGKLMRCFGILDLLQMR